MIIFYNISKCLIWNDKQQSAFQNVTLVKVEILNLIRWCWSKSNSVSDKREHNDSILVQFVEGCAISSTFIFLLTCCWIWSCQLLFRFHRTSFRVDGIRASTASTPSSFSSIFHFFYSFQPHSTSSTHFRLLLAFILTETFHENNRWWNFYFFLVSFNVSFTKRFTSNIDELYHLSFHNDRFHKELNSIS